MTAFMKNTESTEEERELENAYRDARGIAKQHRDLDKKISKESCNMTLSEIKFNKSRLQELAKSLRGAVEKVHKCGGEWSNEQERNALDSVA